MGTGCSRGTFLETREAEEFDEPKVVSGNQRLSAKVGVRRVDVARVRVLLPDPVHFRSQYACPRGPVNGAQLVLIGRLFPT